MLQTIGNVLGAALYGLVEGISEWLPISSTGHMLLLDQFVKLNVSVDFWNMFLVVIQLGAILAVCVLFFHNLNPFAKTKTQGEKKQTWTMWAKIIIACLPAALIGLPLDDWMEEHLGSPFIIAAALIVYGVIFIVLERSRDKKAQAILQTRKASKHAQVASQEKTLSELADEDAQVQSVDAISYKKAFGIGCFQILSLVPGTSRSGSTIIGGLLLGCSRSVVAEFTFYLAIPVMFGASALRLVKFFLKGNMFSATELLILFVGCVVAFVVSMLVIRFLMDFVRKHNFEVFGWYRIILGALVILYFVLVH